MTLFCRGIEAGRPMGAVSGFFCLLLWQAMTPRYGVHDATSR